ncbi:DUF350 domain-containing protein [Ulvibacter antarcticus]|uniref:Uncharacterized protein DUF350 n=1 Tax=Ulvibacter antarcticus TaxID=442714 RepID=A0A3L9Z2I8_9FLAO|nr:DUF350 domain-containing protein [Ulvibacter antarcticus]RMA66350.1 uncharacterized protein DUF350 [Ulvibacter antarcticus]
MNTQLFTLALLEIIISIIATVVILFISYKILKLLFFKKDDLTHDNLAVTIFISGVILSTGIILSEILPSITNVIRIAATHEETINAMSIVKYSGLYLFIGFVAAILINAAVFLLFSMLTKRVNEFREIQQNNTSVAILVVAILISITLIIKDGIALLVSSMVPYPEVTNYL